MISQSCLILVSVFVFSVQIFLLFFFLSPTAVAFFLLSFFAYLISSFLSEFFFFNFLCSIFAHPNFLHLFLILFLSPFSQHYSPASRIIIIIIIRSFQLSLLLFLFFFFLFANIVLSFLLLMTPSFILRICGWLMTQRLGTRNGCAEFVPLSFE